MLSGGTCRACAMAGTAVFKMVVSSDSMKKPTATSQGSSRLAVAERTLSCGTCKAPLGAGQRRIDDCLRLGKQAPQMCIVMKTFCVYLVDVLGPRRTRREPTAARGDLDAADRRVVAWRPGQYPIDRFAGELR